MVDIFSWYFISGVILNVGFGLALTILMFLSYQKKGKMALVILPLVLWHLFWMPWAAFRRAWMYNWFSYSGDYFMLDVYFFMESIIYFALILIALAPLVLDEKPNE